MSNTVPSIHVEHMRKTYRVPEREAGLLPALKSLVKRRSRLIQAVDDLTFRIEPGEIVGFLGPNGAGKTTTLKMLSGLLYPSAGDIDVLGHVPCRREKAFLRQITLIMGNRNQLEWDLPALDSFALNQAIYHIPEQEFRRTRDELIDLLELGALLRKPVRTLSLGERMKMEIAGSLLHRPQVLFLDEPTIGLDIMTQRRIRDFLACYTQRTGSTILLTSHYMADVEALCRRVIVIHHGRLLFDGYLKALTDQFTTYRILRVTLGEPDRRCELARYGTITEQGTDMVRLHVPKADIPWITARLLGDYPISDLIIEEPPIEDVIERVFAQERVSL